MLFYELSSYIIYNFLAKILLDYKKKSRLFIAFQTKWINVNDVAKRSKNGHFDTRV